MMTCAVAEEETGILPQQALALTSSTPRGAYHNAANEVPFPFGRNSV